MKSQAVIRVRFLSASEGGRSTPINAASYGCPLLVDGKAFDCRFVLDRKVEFEVDRLHRIEVAFLSPEAARQALRPGQGIELWEGKVIAAGVVEEVFEE
jgi:hypothetical protein